MTAELWRVDQSPEEASFSAYPQPPNLYCAPHPCALYSSRPLPSPMLDKSSQAHSYLMLLWERASIWKLLMELVFLEYCENWNCPLQLPAAPDPGGENPSVVFRNMACGLLQCQPPPPDLATQSSGSGVSLPSTHPQELSIFQLSSHFCPWPRMGWSPLEERNRACGWGAEPHPEQIRINLELRAGGQGNNLVREILGEGDSCTDVMEERAEQHGMRYAGEGRCMADWTVSMQRWSPHMLVFWVVWECAESPRGHL